MRRAAARLEEILAMGLSLNAIATQWKVNIGHVDALRKMVEEDDLRWHQGLVDALYPDEGWQVELVAYCRGTATKSPLPRYRIGGSRLHERVCPITGITFCTPYKQQVYHPTVTRSMKERWIRQQRRKV